MIVQAIANSASEMLLKKLVALFMSSPPLGGLSRTSSFRHPYGVRAADGAALREAQPIAVGLVSRAV
jgi:hypothetical protein